MKTKTYITRSYPWGLHPRNGHRLLCGDGVIRAASLAQTADTFFSIPASVRVTGKTISGYACTESVWDDETQTEKTVSAFRSHDCHYGTIPQWPGRYTPEHEKLVKENA